MSIERIERTPLDEERLAALRELFPEVFSDGKVNVERLRELLAGEAAEIGPDEEHYGLRWPGQKKARQLANRPATGTLRTAPGEGVNEDTTQNLLVVGDNLEVLRILRKSYEGRVKLIYIDPPYNTGEDFIYRDDFKMPAEVYLEATQQRDFEGLLVSNPKTNGRFHSEWLSMMHPRLTAARNLLRRDGVLCISIDDSEVHNLRHLLEEVFGSENFEGHIHWRRRHNQPNDKTKMIGLVAEHILVFAKDSAYLKVAGVGKVDVTGTFSNPDGDRNGPWATKPWKVGSDQSGSRYVIIGPTGQKFDEEWMGDRATFEALQAAGRIAWPSKDGGLPRKKYYQSEREEEGQCATNWWSHDQYGHNQKGSQQLSTLLGEKAVFSNPKPIELVRGLLQIANVKGNDIVLDFFAGSGTTGEAVMRLNAEDGGNRRFILVQLPEPAQKGDYATIDQITKARLRAASAAIKAEQAGKLDLEGRGPQDLGFRVLHEARSHVKRWIPAALADADEALPLFQSHNGLVADWKPEDLIIEVMLLEGYPLDASATRSADFTDNAVTLIEHPSLPTRLLVCLENEVYDATVEALAGYAKDVFVCLEAPLNDVIKVRIADVMPRVKTL